MAYRKNFQVKNKPLEWLIGLIFRISHLSCPKHFSPFSDADHDCYELMPLVSFLDCRLITVQLLRLVDCPISNLQEALRPWNSVTVSPCVMSRPVELSRPVLLSCPVLLSHPMYCLTLRYCLALCYCLTLCYCLAPTTLDTIKDLSYASRSLKLLLESIS